MQRRSGRVAFSRCSMLVAGLALLAGLPASSAGAEELPLWEVGIGALPSTYPAYRGARDQQNYVLPFPLVAYRGKILKVDRDGVRAQLFDSERVQLNISVNGAIPADSDGQSAREGMPDLDAAFEIGPSLDIVVAEPSPRQTVRIRLPVRSVITTDLRSAERAGWLFNPQLNLDRDGGADGWSAGVSAGPVFASDDYHAYYYDVASQYATADRPAYRASAGYSGAMALATASRRFEHIWVGAFLRYDNLRGAAFADSPLVETNHSLAGGVAVAWVFARSSVTVPAR